jgi:hypothetical protein
MSLCNTCDTDNTNSENSKEGYIEGLDINDSIIDCAKILRALSESEPIQNNQNNKNNKKDGENVTLVYRCCQLCNKTQTPLWRRTNIYHTLCNACGIRERNNNKSKNNGVVRFIVEKYVRNEIN